MNITSRSRYAIKIMMDLAFHREYHHVSRRDISLRQGISPDYLDQIMARLRRGGLVASIRGRSGGYRLAHRPEAISVWQIFHAVEESLYPVECVDDNHSCAYESACVSHSAWEEIFGGVRRHLEATTLESLVLGKDATHQMCPAAGLRFCGAGGVRHDAVEGGPR